MMPRRIGAVLGITMAFLLLASTAALAANQVIENGTTTGSIRVTVRDNGMIGIYRFDATYWIEQVYDGDNKYSMLFLAGAARRADTPRPMRRVNGTPSPPTSPPSRTPPPGTRGRS